MLDTRAVESKPGKAKKKKKVFEQTFLVCSYIMLIFGAAGGGTAESATFPPCSFSARSSIAGIFLQEVKAKWAHSTRSRFAKRPELAAKGGDLADIRGISVGGFVQPDAHANNAMRACTAGTAVGVFGGGRTPVANKEGLVSLLFGGRYHSAEPRLHSSLFLHSGS